MTSDIQNSILPFEFFPTSPVCHPLKYSIKMKMDIEYWWNNADNWKLNNSKKNLSPYHFLYHKYDTVETGIESGSPLWESGHWQLEPGTIYVHENNVRDV